MPIDKLFTCTANKPLHSGTIRKIDKYILAFWQTIPYNIFFLWSLLSAYLLISVAFELFPYQPLKVQRIISLSTTVPLRFCSLNPEYPVTAFCLSQLSTCSRSCCSLLRLTRYLFTRSLHIYLHFSLIPTLRVPRQPLPSHSRLVTYSISSQLSYALLLFRLSMLSVSFSEAYLSFISLKRGPLPTRLSSAWIFSFILTAPSAAPIKAGEILTPDGKAYPSTGLHKHSALSVSFFPSWIFLLGILDSRSVTRRQDENVLNILLTQRRRKSSLALLGESRGTVSEVYSLGIEAANTHWPISPRSFINVPGTSNSGGARGDQYLIIPMSVLLCCGLVGCSIRPWKWWDRKRHFEPQHRHV